ncbi:MAG: DeoR/GlpR family DNA-binding transcription regulator [Pseudomonadota bacterium]|nr:DeoR/GlpR family DNA-binding transcription regulator [Pseudomonadota bacterium]
MDLSSSRPTSRRLQEILAIAREAGRVSVDDLAARFAVTPQTIRRDLNELCDSRRLTRIHGGAMLVSGVENLAYDDRKLVSQPHKRLIGEAAARLVADNSSLFINLGTTTEEVARALGSHTGLLVITNNLQVAAGLHRHKGIEVILCGGTVRRTDGGLVGAAAVAHIDQFRTDLAIIGTSAIDADGTLLDFDIREVEVSQAIIRNARRVILVTDGSKFLRAAPVRIAHLSDVDVLVTDRLPSAAFAALCEANGVEYVEAGGPEEPDELLGEIECSNETSN